MKTTVLAWVLAGAVMTGTAQNAGACAFHGYTPNPTLVDVLLSTDRILIGRIDPNDTGKYLSLEALTGPDTANSSISTDGKNNLAASQRAGGTVLIARDGTYGPWMELAVLDDRYSDLVAQILKRKPAWQLGRDKDRLPFFAARLNDPNPDIRRLALQELDRADYGALQRLRLPVVANLRQDLEAGEDDLTPIRILLAGLSRDQGYSALLSTKLDGAVQSDLPYLGAFATALIEQGQSDAVQVILDRYLTNDTLSTRTKERLLEALAIQYKLSKGATRRFIAKEVAELVRSTPELRQATALQFGFGFLDAKTTGSGQFKSTGPKGAPKSGSAGDR